MASRDYSGSAPERDVEECERDKFDVTIWLNLRFTRMTRQNALSCSDFVQRRSMRCSPNPPPRRGTALDL